MLHLKQQAWNKNYHHEIRLFLFSFPSHSRTRAGSTREQDRARQPDRFLAFPISSGFLSFFLPSPSLFLFLSARCQQTDHPPRWKAETRRRRGWRSDEKEGMRGNDKKSRKIARKIFQARYGELPYPRYEKEIFKRGALIHRWPPSPLRDRRTWPGIKCPIKYCGHVNILVKFSSTSLVRRIDHVFSSRRWYDRRDISSIFFSIVDRCSDFYPIVIWGCNFGDDWMRIGDKIRCNVSAIFGCIWTIACKSFYTYL